MRRLILALLLLAGCGGSAPPPQGIRDVETALRLARADFGRHRYAQAADAYGRAWEVAWRVDDVSYLATVGSERALALLRAGQVAAALDAASAIERELDRRKHKQPELLVLTAAAAELRLGRLDAAARRLQELEPDVVTAPLVAGRRNYLRGRIAAARGDRAGLAAAIAALPDGEPMTLAADRQELEARALLLAGRGGAAIADLVEVERARRLLDELAAVGETLALAGEAAVLAGDRVAAADFYLRAARNAYALERADLARDWLPLAAEQARLAGDAALLEAVSDLEPRVAALAG